MQLTIGELLAMFGYCGGEHDDELSAFRVPYFKRNPPRKAVEFEPLVGIPWTDRAVGLEEIVSNHLRPIEIPTDPMDTTHLP